VRGCAGGFHGSLWSRFEGHAPRVTIIGVVRRRFAQFAWIVLGFNLAVILWGALVRASRSGEGCGDHWPLCNGSVIPHAAQIATIIEFVHRVTSGPVAWVLVAVMAVWAFRSFRGETVARAAMASLVLITIEALLGAGLVLFRYTGTNASAGRVAYLSAHLMNTLLMLGAIALTAWWASGHGPPVRPGPHAKWLGGAIVAALMIGATGAIAALGDTLFPVTSLREGLTADFSGSSPLLLKLRVWHPAVAAMAGIYIAIVAARLRTRFSSTVMVLLLAQMGAGIVNLYLLAPIWMQLVHLLLADLLWIALVLFTAAALEDSPSRARAPQLVSR